MLYRATFLAMALSPSMAQTPVSLACKDVKTSYQSSNCCTDIDASVTLDVNYPTCPMTPDNGLVTDWSTVYADATVPHAPITAYRVVTPTPNRFQPDAPLLHNPVFEMNAYGWWTKENSAFPRPRGTYQQLQNNLNLWNGPSDLSATYQVTHDTEKVYVTAQVQDDVHLWAEPGNALSQDNLMLGLATVDNRPLDADGKPQKQMLINLGISNAGNATHPVYAKEFMFEKNVDEAQRVGVDFTWSRDETNKITTYVVHLPARLFGITDGKFPENFQFGLAAMNNDFDDSNGWEGSVGLNVDALLYCPGTWTADMLDSKCPQYTSLVTLSPHTPPTYMHAFHCSNKPCDMAMGMASTPPMKTWKNPHQDDPSKLPTWTTRNHLSNGWFAREQHESFFMSDANSNYRVAWSTDEMRLTLMTHDGFHKATPGQPWAGDGIQMSWSTTMDNVLTECVSNIQKPDVLMNVNIVPDANGTLTLGWFRERDSGLDLTPFMNAATFERKEDRTYYHFKFSPADFGKTLFSAGDTLPFAYIVVDGNDDPDKQEESWTNQIAWSGVGQYTIVGGKKACASGFLTLDPGTADERASIFRAPEYLLKTTFIETTEPAVTPAELQASSWLNVSLSHPNLATDASSKFGKVLMTFTIDAGEAVDTAAHLTGRNLAQCGTLDYPSIGLQIPVDECWYGHNNLVWNKGYTKGLTGFTTTGTNFICAAMFEGLTEEEKQNVDPDNVDVCFTKKTQIDLTVPATDLGNFHFLLKVTHKPKSITISKIEDENGVQFARAFPWSIAIP